jgi:acetyltransferase-like isoleucine patch superfamily enzyme
MNPVEVLPFGITSKVIEIDLRTISFPLAVMTRACWLGSANHVSTHRLPLSTQFDGALRINGTGDLQIGEYCRLELSTYFETSGAGRITLGRRVRVNTGTHLVSHAELTIGDDVLIGEYVSIRDADHGTAPDQAMNQQAHRCAAIKIGNNVWIGRGACILKGVSICDGAIIAANSVVTRDVGELEIHASIPARLLRKRSTTSEPDKDNT